MERLDALPDVINPLVRSHAHNGHKTPWASASLVIRSIIGMPDPGATNPIDELIAFATREKFVYRHKRRVSDILVWDNRCTLRPGTLFEIASDVWFVSRTWGLQRGSAMSDAWSHLSVSYEVGR